MPYRGSEVRLISRPEGVPSAADFDVVEASISDPEPGQFVVRNEFLALDPFLRLFMSGPRSNHNVYPLNQSPPALAAGRVVASRHADFREGDWAVGPLGWRDYALSDGMGVRTFDPALGDPSWSLGPLGMPGLTAWSGATRVAQPLAGESLYVTAAAGSVGSLVGQIAALRGARVVGSAGTDDKVEWLRQIGFATAFNYREMDVGGTLRRLSPDGFDAAFDNVGGQQLDAVIEALRVGGRATLCGAIGVYNGAADAHTVRNMHLVFMKSLNIRGFRWRDYADRWDEFQNEMSQWLVSGIVTHRQHVIEGLEKTPQAFAETFTSLTIGKTLIRIPA